MIHSISQHAPVLKAHKIEQTPIVEPQHFNEERKIRFERTCETLKTKQ